MKQGKPPWGKQGHGRGRKWEDWGEWGERPSEWQGPGCGLFLRFLFVFGLVALLLLGGMGALALLFTRAAGGSDSIAPLVWLGSCGLALALPILAVTIARGAYRRIATPLADVMAAADAVAEGDFSARVPEDGRDDQFAKLARSFNRMTAELQRSDQLRRNLTADVAHELRTPLHIIQGNLEGVLDGVYEPTADQIEATLAETRMLARLVDDLHTLSQAEAGQLPLHLETVAVPDLLADVETSFGGQAAAKDINLSAAYEGAPEDLLIAADADRLDQVLSNLVVNGLRYTPAGGSVTLGAARAGDAVQITVADTGRGIAAEDLPFVFERFWRGDLSRSHADGAGAGLGLAIARQLVEAHGGTIAASSSEAGTTFTITLPALPSLVG